MIVVGLTGNLASGKSQAARIFKKHGARVFDADLEARKATAKDRPVYRAIVKIFGKSFLKKDGELHRRKLARHVFSHPGELKKLNTLIHPGVIFECIRRARALRGQKGVLVLDVPLLFESGMEGLLDFTVVVRSKKEKIFERARRRGLSRDLAEKILSTQWPPRRKARLADFVVDNNGTVRDLEKKILEVLYKIKK